MKELQIIQIGNIIKDGAKFSNRQSGRIYCVDGTSPTLNTCEHRSEVSANDTRYKMCPDYSYCIDANYWKGTTFEQYLKKRRRQLIIETVK